MNALFAKQKPPESGSLFTGAAAPARRFSSVAHLSAVKNLRQLLFDARFPRFRLFRFGKDQRPGKNASTAAFSEGCSCSF